MQLQGARGATFGASNAFFNTQILANQTGGSVEAITVETFEKYDICTLDAEGKAVLSATPAADSEFRVFSLRTDNSITTAAPTAGTYAEGKVIVDGGVEKDRVLISYTAEVKSGEKIVALADAQNELMNVTAEVLLRELCNEELYYAFIIMKGKLSGEAEWSMTRDGNHAFEITAFPAYCDADRELVKVIIVKGEGGLLPAEE
jgi:hypothetical protein